MKRLFVLLALLIAPHAMAQARAIFAGGCFWCMEPPFEKLEGVISVTSGYTGGFTRNPTYEQVSFETTGHYEAVEIRYDPARITYGQLLDVFWRNIDPEDGSGQFCDRGEQYRAAIFYASAAERDLAARSMANVASKKKLKVATHVLPATRFYPAEEYHQDYYKKNPVRYKFYRFNCGRDRRLEAVWGK